MPILLKGRKFESGEGFASSTPRRCWRDREESRGGVTFDIKKNSFLIYQSAQTTHKIPNG